MRLFSLIVGLTVGSNALQAQGPAVVSGVVREETGSPIREALVVIDPDSLSLRARTSEDGRFRIPGVPAGRYEVRVVRIGFRPHSRTIDVEGRELELEIALAAVPIPLDTVAVKASRPGLYGLVVTRGIALAPHEPRVLRGARVEVVNSPHSAGTGPDGRFSMPLGSGAHGVMVSLEGYVTRLIPVSIAPDGGVEITVVLDSLYAEYQRVDEDQLRGITWRTRRAISPATFIPQHEIDFEEKNLRDGIRYSHALLSRGTVIRSGSGAARDTICVYVNGVARPDVFLQDIDPKEVEALEVYPPNTLEERDRLPLFQRGTDCENLWGSAPPGADARGQPRGPGPAIPRRTPRRALGNTITTVIVWTRGRR